MILIDISRTYLSATLYITFWNDQKSNQKTHRLRIPKRLRSAVGIISMVLLIKCLLPISHRYEIITRRPLYSDHDSNAGYSEYGVFHQKSVVSKPFPNTFKGFTAKIEPMSSSLEKKDRRIDHLIKVFDGTEQLNRNS